MKDHEEAPPLFGEDFEVIMSSYPENRSQDRVNTQREIPRSDNVKEACVFDLLKSIICCALNR